MTDENRLLLRLRTSFHDRFVYKRKSQSMFRESDIYFGGTIDVKLLSLE